MGDVGSSSSSGSANGSDDAVVGRDIAESLEGCTDRRLATYGGGAVSCDSGRCDICMPDAAMTARYGGAGDSSDRTLGRCDRCDATDICEPAAG